MGRTRSLTLQVAWSVTCLIGALLALVLIGDAEAGRADGHALLLPAAYATDTVPVHRIFSGPDGVSHIEVVQWTGQDVQAFGQTGLLDKFFGAPAAKVTVVGGAPGFRSEPHNTGGARTLVYLLGGSSTAIFADGTTAAFKAGDLILLENATGPGTAVQFGEQGYLGLAIALAPATTP